MPARSLVILLVSVLCAAALAEPVSRWDGERWLLENAALQVGVDADAGRFSVLDKTSGYLWRGPDAGAVQTVALSIPRLLSAPVIDGDPADWHGRGATISFTPDMLADARTVDGPADLSGNWKVGWTPQGLFLCGAVQDDRLMPAAADEGEWWYRDSVEFWIGAEQYAVRFGSWGANFWSRGAMLNGPTAAFKASPTGYSLEFMLPAGLLGDVIAKGPGAALRFALGINDCDGEDGRQGQLYYPRGWVHSNPDTFARFTLADESGQAPAAAPSREPVLTYRDDSPAQGNRLVFQGSAGEGSSRFPVSITFRLEGDAPDLWIDLDTEDRSRTVGRFSVLHPLVLDRPNGRILAAAYCNGIGVPTDDMSWRGRQWYTWGIDMPWVGVSDGDIGYMLLWELPVSCDNGSAILERAPVGGRDLLAPSANHYPIKGTFGEPRSVRYSFCPSGGHVAICKRYRDYAKENGFLVTQYEKMKVKPHLERLLGAPDIWGRSDLKFCREAKAAGIDRMLVNSPQPWDDMKKIEALGYLMGVYDNYEDAFEGDSGKYGDFVEADDVVINADGSRMKAWLTKGDKPKQFMKRCSALHEAVSRRWVPKELAQYPYNARFIDVTTATGLRECYHEKHPLTRTDDRRVKRGLAAYQGNELNLVLGGEHGRWWGADIFNYWEGMQSGGFYSWPAGYVGLDIPQTREEIGRQYLDWGIGEANRYPLWELVFHDCVVSTWYWGDSTGHLRHAAPELGYKKDAFNILYGTVPLYWVAQDYSYKWDVPETRERLLESYRNTCKLHEVIGFEELVSHEFVTEDRAVQHTVFGDGTNVWVNFGEKPWTLEADGQSWEIPQFGFYAKGPKIEQYRVNRAWVGSEYRGIDDESGRIGGVGAAKRVTCIRKDGYLFVEGDVPGLVESFLGSPVTAQREGPARISINAPLSKWVRVNWRALCPDAGEGDWRIVALDEAGQPVKIGEPVKTQNDMLMLPIGMPVGPVLLIGPAEIAQMTELSISSTRKSPDDPDRSKQGDPLTVALTVENQGGKDSGEVSVAAYLGRVSEETRLGTKSVSVPAGGTAEVEFTFPSQRYDGLTTFWFRVDDGDAVTELCEQDNTTERGFMIEPDLALWDGKLSVTVDMGELPRRLPIAKMPFDPDAEWQALGKQGKADPGAIRVMKEGEESAYQRLFPCQYDAQAKELSFEMLGRFEPGQKVRCEILLDGADEARHQAPSASWWKPQESVFHSPRMVVRFKEGYIRGVESQYPFVKIIGNLGVSSADTGWVDEVGEVESFDVVQDGPVFTQIRVKKNLRGNHSYDKLYTLYRNHFTVTMLSPERFGVPSRAYYLTRCLFEDDKGNRSVIDGKGDAEGVSGKNPNPRWYATWPEPEQGKEGEPAAWALSCVAVTPHESLTYWDAGSWAGVGFNPRQQKGATVAYVLHNAEDEVTDVPGFAELDYQRMQQPVVLVRD